jgi:crotonobetainyl-CoA:carnitine CoA-transferase CaiB-like acyl-CoA transferase
MTNYTAAAALVAEIIAGRSVAEWIDALTGIEGQWALVQSPWEIANDDALTANGRIVGLIDADGQPQKLVANPVKFDNAPVRMTRAPQFAEHTDEILRELGADDDTLIDLKIAGAVT